MLWTGSALLLVIAAGSCFGDTPLDRLVDELLLELGRDMVKTGKDRIRLPEIHLHKDLPFVGDLDFPLSLHLENGWFLNASTLYRVGDVQEVDSPDGTALFQATLGMRVVQVKEEDFTFTLGLISGSGAVDAQVEHASLDLELSLRTTQGEGVGGGCNVTLNRAAFSRLDTYRASFRPVGLVNRVKSFLFTAALDLNSLLIRKVADDHVTAALRDLLNRFDPCSLLPLQPPPEDNDAL